MIQKNEALPNLDCKKKQKPVKYQLTSNYDDQNQVDDQALFRTAQLDESGILNEAQNQSVNVKSDKDYKIFQENAPKDEAESVYQNLDNSFIRSMDQNTQNFHKQFIYMSEEGHQYQDPNLSKQDKQTQFLSQLPFIQQVIKNQENSQNRLQAVKQQLDHQTTRIFKEIKQFSIGNYKYQQQLDNHQNKYIQKKYIPIFPSLYLKNNIDYNEPGKFNELSKFNIKLADCVFYNKFGLKKNQNEYNNQIQEDDQKNEQKKYPTHIQLKFSVDNKDFLKGTREHKLLIDEIIQNKCEEDARSKSEQEGFDFEKYKKERLQFYQENDKENLDREIKSKKRDFQYNIKLLGSRQNVNFAPKIYYQYDEDIEGNLGNFDLVIEQMVPGEFMEGKTVNSYTKWYNSLSPLQYDNDLINYWNLKQVIFVRGQKQSDFDPEIYLNMLVEQELIQSFENKIPKEYDFSHVNISNEEGSQDDKIINKINFENLQKDLNQIKELGAEFDIKIQKLAMPLRLSVMVLVSNQRVQIFDRNIIDLIDYLVEKEKFTFENQQKLQIEQSEKYWNSDKPERFNYKQYQIAIEQLFFKTGLIQIDKPLEDKGLIGIINEDIKQIYKTEKSKLAFQIKEQTKNSNKLAQRRIWMTPTVKIIRPMELEQSNPLLRQLKQVLEYFVRINIMNDNYQDFFFNNEMQNNLLQHFVQPIIKEIDFCGIKYKFLNYSASQIKSKSWWQLIDNHGFQLDEDDTQSQKSDIQKQISLIENRETLLNFMGKFNDPKQLKQLARQGQSMSSSIHICDIQQQNFRIIEDVRNQSYAFTDGCGYISQQIMDKVCQEFDFYKASAIQMRYSGFKGVLMVHPGLGSASEADQQKIEILFSEGMKKFEGNIQQLSVIRCATFSPGFLNRQVILILSHLGVKDEVFIQKNTEAIERLDIKKTLAKLYKLANKI